MESLQNFEWYRDVAGYRLAWLSKRGGSARWVTRIDKGWSQKQAVDNSSSFELGATQYQGETRVAPSGLYVVGQRQYLHNNKPDESWTAELVRPFATSELLSRNVLDMASTPKGWLDFTNTYGMLGHRPPLDRWHISGIDGDAFIGDAEYEGEWHHLVNVLSRIYRYYPKIEKRDSGGLSRFIKWESENVVREHRPIKIGKTNISPAIAMRGEHNLNAEFFEFMQPGDTVLPAALVLTHFINGYLKKSLSLEVCFDPKTLQFTSSLRYGSLGGALIAEAVEFMTGSFEARKCEMCGSWFRIGANQNRKDRIFCSAACKMRAYRARKTPLR